MPDRAVEEPILLTYDDYCELPDDGRRYEILDGDLFMSPSPRTLHPRVLLRLARTLMDHAEKHDLGEVFVAPYDVILTEHDIVEPDLIFVSQKRQGIVTEEHIVGAPDLLVEILSPTRPLYDTRDKRRIYERAGVPHFWIIDAERHEIVELQLNAGVYTEVCRLTGAACFQPRLFPELNIALNQLWA